MCADVHSLLHLPTQSREDHLEHVPVLQPEAGEGEVGLAPHLQQVTHQGPGGGPRRRRGAGPLRLGPLVGSPPAPEGQQEEGEDTQSQGDPGHVHTPPEEGDPEAQPHGGGGCWRRRTGLGGPHAVRVYKVHKIQRVRK